MSSPAECLAPDAALAASPPDLAALAAPPPPDFAARRVVCLLGLPFDAIGLDAAVAAVRGAATSRTPCLVSTANLNFLVAARHDAAFRQSLLHSQLCLADGMPIVWMARALGLPLAERVAGASLFEALAAPHAGRPLGVYFFGGPDGAAEAACRALERQRGGLRGVGHEAPGFGSVVSMSGAATLARINASGADFLVVALGARKGQAWIEHNRARLVPPVVSHLGAVVNFAAGRLRRAPLALQRLGLEWLWRIKEEPGLWRRYAGDAAALLGLLMRCVLPLVLQRAADALRPPRGDDGEVTLARTPHAVELRLAGRVGAAQLDRLRPALAEAAAARRSVVLDVARLRRIDAHALGLLLLLAGHQHDIGHALRWRGVSAGLRRQLRWHGAEYVLDGGE